MAKDLFKVKDHDRQMSDLLIQKEVLETNLRHLSDRFKINEQAIEQKDAIIEELVKETKSLQTVLRQAEESNLSLKA